MTRLPAYGITYNSFSNEDAAITFFDEQTSYGFLNGNYPCFANYRNVYSKNKTFYLIMPMTYWIDEVVKQWNEKFNNIKIVIVKSTTMGMYSSTDSWGDKVYKYSTERSEFKHAVTMFKFELNTDYNELAQYIIPRMVGTILRYFSVNDRFTQLEIKQPNDIFKYICELNSDPKSQGTDNTLLQENDGGRLPKLTPEIIFMLDNIELINKAFEKEDFYSTFNYRKYKVKIGSHFYQTAIWNHIYSVSMGDSIEYSPERICTIDFNEAEFINLARSLTGQ